MLEYKYNGIILTNSIFQYISPYTGVLTFTENIDEEEIDSWIKTEIYVQTPMLISPLAWERYKYTPDDLVTILKMIDKTYIWQLAFVLSLGKFDIEKNGLKDIKFKNLFSFQIDKIDKPLQWLLEYHQTLNIKYNHSALNTNNEQHVPYIPIIFSNQHYELPDSVPSLWNQLTLPIYNDGIDYIVLNQVDDLYYGVRVSNVKPPIVHEKIYNRNIVSEFVSILDKDNQLWYLTDEAFFIQTTHPTNKNKKQRLNK